MSKIKVFRTATLVLFFLSLLSAALHVFLFMADSPEYRQWVSIQIGLQVGAAVLLVFIHRLDIFAFLALIPLSIVFTYINATFVNYGHTVAIYLVFIVAWLAYGTAAKGAWSESQKLPGGAT